MNQLILGALLAVSLFGASLATIFDGPCQEVEVIRDFDVNRYRGTWYELYRYENEAQGTGECSTSEIYVEDDNVNVRMYNRFVQLEPEFEVIDLNMTGFVSYPNLDPIPGLLSLSADGVPTTHNYLILATDYDNYAIVWNCREIENNQNSQSAWVLSRRTYFNPEIESEARNLMANLLDVYELRETYNDIDGCLGGIEPAK